MGKTKMANKIWKKIKCNWRKILAICSNKNLSAAEYAATTAAKRRDKKKGKQHSKQPKSIANKTRKYRV